MNNLQEILKQTFGKTVFKEHLMILLTHMLIQYLETLLKIIKEVF